jgi:4-diphosphocytidyl-2-C-methyl-D-erythritol kinase
MQYSYRAYAKINLGLRVLRKRPDGYHDIETVFHCIDVYDSISFEPSNSITIQSSSPDVPSDETNLCHKAATLLRERMATTKGVAITLTKRIPIGAGLGGGSSDAATILRHLPQFWGASLAEPVIRTMAEQLGSDVPYFLVRGTARATGRGEILEYFPLDVPYTIVVCNPGVHISTSWAYGQIRPQETQSRISLKDSVLDGMRNPSTLQDTVKNDFESPITLRYPEIGSLKCSLVENGALFSLMSGSGSTVYGIFGDPERADFTAKSLSVRGVSTYITAPGFQPPEW